MTSIQEEDTSVKVLLLALSANFQVEGRALDWHSLGPSVDLDLFCITAPCIGEPNVWHQKSGSSSIALPVTLMRREIQSTSPHHHHRPHRDQSNKTLQLGAARILPLSSTFFSFIRSSLSTTFEFLKVSSTLPLTFRIQSRINVNRLLITAIRKHRRSIARLDHCPPCQDPPNWGAIISHGVIAD